MNIKKLKQKRQLNVQEQNVLQRHSIYNEALYWRKQGLPECLEVAFASRGVQTRSCIVLNYERDFPGMCSDYGVVLTCEGQFFEFEAELNKARNKVIDFEHWQNITTDTPINEHQPGTGATWGYLALEVLSQLNAAKLFTVEFVQVGKPVRVFVSQLAPCDFSLTDNSTLNGCPIAKAVSQPRASKPDGSPDFDIYCFQLLNGMDKDKFVEGDTVELIP